VPALPGHHGSEGAVMNKREAHRIALMRAAGTIESSLNSREDLDEYMEVDKDGNEVNKVVDAMWAIAERLAARAGGEL